MVSISIGFFVGALVSGLAGFAFSAVAAYSFSTYGPPTEAVPLMMACSMVVQASLAVLAQSHHHGVAA
jgi:hypothetical protein